MFPPTYSVPAYSMASQTSKVPAYTIDPKTCQENLIVIVLGLKESEHAAISNFSSSEYTELENALAKYVQQSQTSPTSVSVHVSQVRVFEHALHQLHYLKGT